MKPITAFVTGADHPTGLGAGRALHEAGARVVGFTRRPEKWTCLSRAWKELRVLEGRGPGARVEEVIQAASAVDGPVFLLPTEDELVREFSESREMFPENVRITLPPREVVQLLLEKTRFLQWARDKGYPLPDSVVAGSAGELKDLLKDFRFPAVLKPLVRTPGWQKASPVKKAILLNGPGDLDDVDFDLFEAAPSYVLSEWIEGEDSDVLFCLVFLDENSEVVASHTGRKLLQYPRLTGSTAICMGQPDPELEAMTAKLFKDVGCQGLASLEVKRSTVDGRYLITEPTVGRPNLQSYSAVAAGVNLHGIAMRHTWGQEFSDLVKPAKPCIWVEEQALFEVLTTPTAIPLQSRLIASKLFATRRLRGAYFRLLDPKPALAMVRSWFGNAFRRLGTGDSLRFPGRDTADT